MRKILFSLSLLATFSSLCQDLIVTNSGDSIECKITRIEVDFIHFTVLDERSGIVLMRSRLPISSISHYAQNKIELEYPKTVLKEEDIVVLDEIKPTMFRLALNAGYTYQLEGYAGYPNSYKRQLESLWSVGGEIHFFMFDDHVGLGIKYNYAFTNANDDFNPPFGNTTSIKDEKVTFTYFGGSLLYRMFLVDDQVLNFSVAIGNLKYNADGFINGRSFQEDGQTLGVALGFNYDFIFIQNLGIGIGAELNIAKLTELNSRGVNKPVDFGISRIDLILGLRVF